MDEDLTVTAAAIQTDDGDVFHLLPPARHSQVIRMVREMGYDGPVGGSRQGLLLSDGTFANRREAMKVAKASGQVNKTIHNRQLFSEDLW